MVMPAAFYIGFFDTVDVYHASRIIMSFFVLKKASHMATKAQRQPSQRSSRNMRKSQNTYRRLAFICLRTATSTQYRVIADASSLYKT